MLGKCLGHWTGLWRQADHQRDLERQADDYLRQKSFTHYMTVWMAKYQVRQKKKRLEVRVKQVEKMRSYRFFAHWLALFKKQQYLDDQLDSIIAIKAESAVQDAFEAL